MRKTDINTILKNGANAKLKTIDYSTPAKQKELKELKKKAELSLKNKQVSEERLQIPYNFYYGCDIYYPSTKEFHKLNWTHFLSLEQLDYKPDWKLCLRKLSDMTEDEMQEWEAISFVPEGYMKRSVVIHAETTKYLLSKHFDLFNLIPEGLAVDATTLTPSHSRTEG